MTTSSIIADPKARLHFVGIAGAGMSALARFRLDGGGRVSGSDREFDRGHLGDERAALEAAGVQIFPQDGSGTEGASMVIASTAVEAAIPDLVQASEHAVPTIHRAELLAAHVAERPTIAITGTSGKSTVVAMVFEGLVAAGLDPGVITGGELIALQVDGRRGNSFRGTGPLVIEADESDKSLLRYHPRLGVVLNLHKDHDTVEAYRPVFAQFMDQSEIVLIGDDAELAPLRSHGTVFGEGECAAMRGSVETTGPNGSTVRFGSHEIEVPIPGRHNGQNALAACAVAEILGVDMGEFARGIESFGGVHRRFEIIDHVRGIEVIDDFAHNPTKIRAALEAATARGTRCHAIFQPHGFGPTRFFRDELVTAFLDGLGPDDRLYLPEIFFAGGSAVRDISSADLAQDVRAGGGMVAFHESRTTIPAAIAAAARAGDVVISMGARDPSLHAFARSIVEEISETDDDDIGM